jgi:hypothetical protein
MTSISKLYYILPFAYKLCLPPKRWCVIIIHNYSHFNTVISPDVIFHYKRKGLS